MYISDLWRMLGFRIPALHSLAGRGSLAGGVAVFCIGFLAYALVRNSVYAHLPEMLDRQPGLIGSFFDLNLIRTVLFLMLIYIPALIILGNGIAGRKRGFSISGKEYISQASLFFPLWGLLFLVTAPIQWLAPHFLIAGMFEISVGLLVRSILLLVYTAWAIRHLNNVSQMQSLAAFAFSLFTLPLYFLLISL